MIISPIFQNGLHIAEIENITFIRPIATQKECYRYRSRLGRGQPLKSKNKLLNYLKKSKVRSYQCLVPHLRFNF